MANWQYISKCRNAHKCQMCGAHIFEGCAYYRCGNRARCTSCMHDGRKSTKVVNKYVELVLCFLFGYLGAHKFYTGQSKMGFVYLCTVGLFGIGWIYDLVKIAIQLFKVIDRQI